MAGKEQFLYQCKQIRKIEQLAIEKFQLTEEDMMDRAGKGAFQLLQSLYPHVNKIAVYCGGGNNGGDGYVLAYYAIKQGFDVAIYREKPIEDLPTAAARAAVKAKAAHIPFHDFSTPLAEDCELIVDALLGIGLEGEVRGNTLSAIAAIHQSNLPVLALDLPSGLNADTGQVYNSWVTASHTVTFIARKTGMYTLDGLDCCGLIHCVDLGLNEAIDAVLPDAVKLTEQETLTPFPPRKRNSHKGDYGRLLVIGGGPGMPGAAAMTGMAALRMGAGAVKLATWPEHQNAYLALCPELMVEAIDKADSLEPLLDWATALAIGPGLGLSEWAASLLAKAVVRQIPMVVDASALRLLASMKIRSDHWILTPHPGEAQDLLQSSAKDIQASRFEAVQQLQQKYGGVVILKGAGSLIQSPDSIPYVCSSGNPGMATAGMGDILTGMIAGLLAQGFPAFESSLTAVWMHGRAADKQARETGQYGMMASDLLAWLPLLMNGLSA